MARPIVGLVAVLLGCTSAGEHAPSSVQTAPVISRAGIRARSFEQVARVGGDFGGTGALVVSDRAGAFETRTARMTAYFDRDGFALSVPQRAGRWGVHARLVGGHAQQPFGEGFDGLVHQLRGSRSTQKSAVQRVVWEDVWPGVDLAVLPRGSGFEFAYWVQPGADPAAVRIRWDGIEGIESVEGGASLRLRAGEGAVTLGAVRAFELEPSGPRFLPARHVFEGTTTGIVVEGATGRFPVFVDPAVDYWAANVGSTLGTLDTPWPVRVVLDGSTNDVIVAGTLELGGFPTTPGALKPTVALGPGRQDAVVCRLTASGTRKWATYLGGSGGIEQLTDLAVDDAGNAVLSGFTTSVDFPTSAGAHASVLVKVVGGGDGFLTKLSPTGAMVWSTYLGLGGTVERLASSTTGTITLSGNVSSTGLKLLKPYQTTPSTLFAAQFSSGGALEWSTYLGTDGLPTRVVRAAGNMAIVGTTPTSFPVTEGVSSLGKSDGFVAEMTATGSLARAFVVGGSDKDSLVDAAYVGGRYWLMGSTESLDMPGLSGAKGEFVTKLAGPSTVDWAHLLSSSARALAVYGPTSETTTVELGGCPTGGLPYPYADPSTLLVVRRLRADGSERWATCYGFYARGWSVALGPLGDAYVGVAAGSMYKGPLVVADGGNPSVLHLPAPQKNGTACVHRLECASDHCVDGVCCDTACDGKCQACSAATKASGVDGVCGNAKVDTDPGERCPVGTTACGPDGLCDDAGACRSYSKPGTVCGAPSCSGGTQTNKLCKGDSDTCLDVPVSCAGYACDATTCKTSCAGDGDCIPGAYCLATVCTARFENGKACSADRLCASGHCVDGVCCDKTCEGQCEACDGATPGTCAPVSGPPHGSRLKCDGVDECAGVCDGKNTLACTAIPVGKECKARCDGGNETIDRCNELGGCKPGAPVSCGAYTCGTDRCKIACTTTADCAVGAACVAGKCGGAVPNGAACTTAIECASGHCVDGVCCDSKCGGQCEACDGPVKGTCAPVDGFPHGKRPPCEGLVCGSRCVGDRFACRYPLGTVCGATCTEGTEKVSRCDGKGHCAEGTPATCTEGCAGERCTGACERDADCGGAGVSCVEGRCKAAPVVETVVGCGCVAAGTGGSPAGVVAVLALAAMGRRRRPVTKR